MNIQATCLRDLKIEIKHRTGQQLIMAGHCTRCGLQKEYLVYCGAFVGGLVGGHLCGAYVCLPCADLRGGVVLCAEHAEAGKKEEA